MITKRKYNISSPLQYNRYTSPFYYFLLLSSSFFIFSSLLFFSRKQRQREGESETEMRDRVRERDARDWERWKLRERKSGGEERTRWIRERERDPTERERKREDQTRSSGGRAGWRRRDQGTRVMRFPTNPWAKTHQPRSLDPLPASQTRRIQENPCDPILPEVRSSMSGGSSSGFRWAVTCVQQPSRTPKPCDPKPDLVTRRPERKTRFFLCVFRQLFRRNQWLSPVDLLWEILGVNSFNLW